MPVRVWFRTVTSLAECTSVSILVCSPPLSTVCPAGVDIIYIYDNEETPTYHKLFMCNPRVVVMHFPWQPYMKATSLQVSMHAHFFEHHKHKHVWAMLPNADEFIVMHNFGDVKARAVIASV